MTLQESVAEVVKEVSPSLVVKQLPAKSMVVGLKAHHVHMAQRTLWLCSTFTRLFFQFIKNRMKCKLPFNFSAKGSLMSIAITFQSVSPSSIKAMTPRTLTCFTSPREATYRNIKSFISQSNDIKHGFLNLSVWSYLL